MCVGVHLLLLLLFQFEFCIASGSKEHLVRSAVAVLTGHSYFDTQGKGKSCFKSNPLCKSTFGQVALKNKHLDS